MEAGEGTRTLDLRLGKPTLYQLSYARKAHRVTVPATRHSVRAPIMPRTVTLDFSPHREGNYPANERPSEKGVDTATDPTFGTFRFTATMSGRKHIGRTP